MSNIPTVVKMEVYPVAAKDMATMRGRDVGVPYLPTMPTPEGAAREGFRRTMTEAGLL